MAGARSLGIFGEQVRDAFIDIKNQILGGMLVRGCFVFIRMSVLLPCMKLQVTNPGTTERDGVGSRGPGWEGDGTSRSFQKDA